ncbi:hypothetical protein L226DRAFT_290028 [Lentinus tigrinus ALCF2SS1-7]|uniref:uncharacterized protein n=1 Tax=Lentinus tigrinus ALCF2SS1-7 TaxID=1328758 RepID=UPI001165CB9B|nr:hypothetical protein L226DRAFT_290028 [Lentinus tigrinus ALCF2SS1-7]
MNDSRDFSSRRRRKRTRLVMLPVVHASLCRSTHMHAYASVSGSYISIYSSESARHKYDIYLPLGENLDSVGLIRGHQNYFDAVRLLTRWEHGCIICERIASNCMQRSYRTSNGALVRVSRSRG